MSTGHDPGRGILVLDMDQDQDQVQVLIQAHGQVLLRPDLTPCTDQCDEISTFTIPGAPTATDHQTTHHHLHIPRGTAGILHHPLFQLARPCPLPFTTQSRPTGRCPHFRLHRLRLITDFARL